VQTRLALAAMLNWSYLDPVVAKVGATSPDWRPLAPWVEDNRAVAYLQSLGYQFVLMPSWFAPLTRNRHAELTVPSPGRIRAEFTTVWAGTTLWKPLAHLACSAWKCEDYEARESASLEDWKFEQLGALARSRRPRFVLAHLVLPHEPFVYRADCTHRRPLQDTGPLDTLRAAYIAQIQCVNQKVLRLVDAIRRMAPGPPVILLQADHGHGQMGRGGRGLKSPTAARVRERTDIFAAYAVPGAPDTLWYDTITPVNVLPRVFNQLFGLRLPRLPDATYWSSFAAPFQLTKVE
jgi:hypothetical protein